MDDHNLERFIGLANYIICSLLLNHVLNHGLIVRVSLTGGQLNVVPTLENDTLYCGGACFRYLDLLDGGLELVDVISIQLLQNALNESSFASTTGTVQENMREILGICNGLEHSDLLLVELLSV